MSKQLRTLKTLRPGQKGSKGNLARFGEQRACVRYRYDDATGERLTTVELVFARVTHAGAKLVPATLALRVAWCETELPQRVKAAGAAGAWWDARRRVWLLRRDRAERLRLLHRVLEGTGG